jgi:hypothetical protein
VINLEISLSVSLSLGIRIKGWICSSGNTKRGSITAPLTSCLTGLDSSVLQINTKIVSCHTADSKPVKQEVNSTVILPPLVFPEEHIQQFILPCVLPLSSNASKVGKAIDCYNEIESGVRLASQSL